MPLIFDVFGGQSFDLMLSTLAQGRSLESENVPLRLAINNTKAEIMAVVEVGGTDLCLGPFKVSDKGIEEAVYDSLHCLESHDLIDHFMIVRPDVKDPKAESHGRSDDLDTALRTQKSLTMTDAPHVWVITPIMKQGEGSDEASLEAMVLSNRSLRRALKERDEEVQQLKAVQSMMDHEICRYRDSLKEIEQTSHPLPISVLDFIDAVLDHDGRKINKIRQHETSQGDIA